MKTEHLKPFQFARRPPRTAARIMRELFARIDDHTMTVRELSKKTGIHEVTLSKWRHGKSNPNIYDVENIADVLGFQLSLAPKETGDASTC